MIDMKKLQKLAAGGVSQAYSDALDRQSAEEAKAAEAAKFYAGQGGKAAVVPEPATKKPDYHAAAKAQPVPKSTKTRQQYLDSLNKLKNP